MARPPQEVGAIGRPRWPAILLAIGAATAALQVGVVAAWPNTKEHLGAVALGWAGALFVAFGRRGQVVLRERWEAGWPGAVLWLAACSATVAGHAGYQPIDRLLPLLAGLGLALLAAPPRSLPGFSRELILLALPLLDPLPGFIRLAVQPIRQTAEVAAFYLRVAGVPAHAEGTLLRLPRGTLEVVEGCSGMTAILQLLMLAILVCCLFPTRLWQKLGMALVAVGVGFAVNAGRVAVLATVADRAADEYEYWDGYGLGALLFPVVATVLALALWWGLVRLGQPGRGRPRPGAAGA